MFGFLQKLTYNSEASGICVFFLAFQVTKAFFGNFFSKNLFDIPGVSFIQSIRNSSEPLYLQHLTFFWFPVFQILKKSATLEIFPLHPHFNYHFQNINLRLRYTFISIFHTILIQQCFFSRAKFLPSCYSNRKNQKNQQDLH